jgi:hypothetical protein
MKIAMLLTRSSQSRGGENGSQDEKRVDENSTPGEKEMRMDGSGSSFIQTL